MSTTPTVPGDFGTIIPVPYTHNVPDHLRRATTRLQFPPTYVVVGVYRLITDKSLSIPAWKKCEHGVIRGLGVGLAWTFTTFKIQRYFVEIFLINSPRVIGLSKETVFGFHMPFDLPTYAALFFITSQVSAIVTFFVSHGLRIARERAYAQTIQSRGKGNDFWRPYVEEWDIPPKVSGEWGLGHLASGFIGRAVFKFLLMPVETVPLVGLMISAYLRALGTARYLHKPYFQAKGMSKEQTSIFMEEPFGFFAALLERIPLLGLVFSVSNRIGAAMWAVDLEKRQHYVASLKSESEGSVFRESTVETHWFVMHPAIGIVASAESYGYDFTFVHLNDDPI
ncbi:uncharacterized protein FIBRA_05967 [Fibroporia radiculosa]|uniref:Uncharacterized protein n=1 Tax=Fibroporia radiculosa TaxID=599839 RepID=J4GAF3_9APHY|nr:uncharacterized protein FIBRA_05967 [Fibroporia radiculosa]CCM03818.1 predicted protein [Fibroporia radiculosa]